MATDYLENTLLLTVNRDKTHITHSFRGVKYLGVEIFSIFTLVQEEKITAFKRKVKSLTKKNQGMNLEMVIRRLNPVLRGFANYFRIANCRNVFRTLMEWVRRRLRAIQLKLWKKPGRLHRRLRQLGVLGSFKKMKMDHWCNSSSQLSSLSMPNKWFDELGLFNMYHVETGIIVPV